MKPMIFSTPIARALLNTKPGAWPAEPIDCNKPFKWQTRRVMKPQPDKDDPNFRHCTVEGFQGGPPSDETWYTTGEGEDILLKPPYKLGDILWVRETWNKNPRSKPDNMHALGYCGYCSACLNIDDLYIYKATFTKNKEGNTLYPCNGWKPSIHMPREAARIFLEVKSIRIMRLQDITEEGAFAEGIDENSTK